MSTSSARPVPRYVEIRERLENAIVSGEWPPGHRLPSEMALAEEFGCARMTVSKVVAGLAEAGLVTRRRRAGTFVASPRPQETTLRIHSIPSEVRALGRSYRFEVLTREERKADRAEAEQLDVRVGTLILALEVLHRADETPFALEQRIINLKSAPEARAEAFDADPPGAWLQRLLPWTDAEHHILALNADAMIAARLGVPEGSACLCDDRRSWHGGAVVTHVRLTYPGDRRLVAHFHASGGRRRNGDA